MKALLLFFIFCSAYCQTLLRISGKYYPLDNTTKTTEIQGWLWMQPMPGRKNHVEGFFIDKHIHFFWGTWFKGLYYPMKFVTMNPFSQHIDRIGSRDYNSSNYHYVGYRSISDDLTLCYQWQGETITTQSRWAGRFRKENNEIILLPINEKQLYARILHDTATCKTGVIYLLLTQQNQNTFKGKGFELREDVKGDEDRLAPLPQEFTFIFQSYENIEVQSSHPFCNIVGNYKREKYF